MPSEKPYIVVTALLNSGARPAPITLSHGDAMDRAFSASDAHDLAGLDIVELPVAPKPFSALRKALELADGTVALYDVFPLASHLEPEVRKVAAQFLAAEALWTLEEQGQLGGVPLNVRLDLPKGWDKDPKAIHARLMEAGALDLSTQAVEVFKAIKTTWDATPPAPPPQHAFHDPQSDAREESSAGTVKAPPVVEKKGAPATAAAPEAPVEAEEAPAAAAAEPSVAEPPAAEETPAAVAVEAPTEAATEAPTDEPTSDAEPEPTA